MADRVKYFLLGLLFLVVAGVIAYDKWNSVSERLGEEAGADRTASISMGSDPAPEPPRITEPRPPPAKPERLDVTPPRAEPELRKPAVAPPPRPKVTPRPKPPAATERIHVVKSGESLEAIALRYYNTRKGIAWIVEANKIRDPNRIRANQRLVIPARNETATTERRAEPASGRVRERYTVKDGDGDLYAICRRFYGASGEGARVARVMELNGLWSADVKAGTVLKLPPK